MNKNLAFSGGKSTLGKAKSIKPLWEQVRTWRDLDDSLHGDVDDIVFSKLQAEARQDFFFPFLIPKQYLLGFSEESYWLEILMEACNHQGIEFFDERPKNSKPSLASPAISEDVSALCESQKGKFIAFKAQFGQEHRYPELQFMPLAREEFPLSVSMIAGILCSQRKIGGLFQCGYCDWWIAAAYPTSDSRSPCFKYRKNSFCGEKDALELTSLDTLFYYNPHERSNGGFASAIRIG